LGQAAGLAVGHRLNTSLRQLSASSDHRSSVTGVVADLLFYRGDLRGTLENIKAKLAHEIAKTPDDHVLEVDEEAWADALAERYRVEAPALRRDEMWQEEPQLVDVDVSHDFTRAVFPGERALIPGYRVVIHIPFDGDGGVFQLRASQFTLNPPRAEVRDRELIDVVEYPHDAPADVKAHANQIADSVERHLVYSRNDIEQYNASLSGTALQAIRQRRAQVERHQAHLAATGLPVGPPDREAKTYIADALVRLPAPELPQREEEPVQLEPVLAADVFEHILALIRSSGEMMESSPATYAAMGEEDLRQVILTNLNSAYRGKVTAEAFNLQGKTDILVRHEGSNLFIGECKVWTGAKGFSATIDQLFRYTGWRDTKLAIVMFVRERDLTSIIESARQVLGAHDRFMAWGQAATETELRATVNWPGDERRHADLNVFFVHTPTKA
jgi:hypothetical protein